MGSHQVEHTYRSRFCFPFIGQDALQTGFPKLYAFRISGKERVEVVGFLQLVAAGNDCD